MPGPITAASISIEGDQDAGQQYVPRAQKLLRRMIERMELGGVQVASDHVRLDDTAYCYAIAAHAVAKAVIVVEGSRAVQHPAPPTSVVPQVPDFYSGAVQGGTIPTPPDTTQPTPRMLYSFWPTSACAKMFTLPDAVQPTAKLAVEPYSDLADALSPPETYQGPPYSQYVKLKPTMYSGLMRQVVQLLMGFGRQAKKSLYDKTPPPIGTLRERQRATQPTAYQSEVQRSGLQIRYDWRWHRTHGILRGQDGRLWLVEIGLTRGVLAMPLTYNTFSQRTAFRDKLEAMGDSAGLYALDALGGFPTGETLPTTAMDSWVRAGRVLRLLKPEDMQVFYNHGAFSSALGWAFNDAGTEAHNTCVSHDDDFFQTAYHYAINFTVGAQIAVTPNDQAPALKQRFSSMQSDERYAAVLWKIDRLDADQVREYLHMVGPAAWVFEQLDALTVAPQANASARLWLQEQGRLYKLGRLAQTELKFPSPELGFLVSWDMQPAISTARFHGLCDTTVHVFFAGNELKYVRFFNDQQTKPWEVVTDDSDGCNLMGTFTHTEEHGTLALPIMVYSNDLDDRDQLASSRSVSVGTGIDLGYSSVQVADSIVYPPLGHLTRTKRFRYCVDTKTWNGEGLQSAMVVPFYDRCAYYYAKAATAQSTSHSTSCVFRYQADPWACDTWRNFPGYTGDWVGDLNNGYWRRLDQHPSGCGPVTARTVSDPGAYYQGAGACADFADQGPWCNVCDNADGMLYQIPEPPLPAPINESQSQPTKVTTWLVNASPLTPILLSDGDPTTNTWFLMSPDPETNLTQYAEVTHNALGDGSGMRYSQAPNGAILTRGSPAPPDMAHNNTTFIGVT